RVDRERGTLDYLQKLAPGLNLRVNYTHDYKEGTKLSSTGVYQRATFNAGALPTTSGEGGERWRVVVIEVPEVVDYDTDMVTAGLDLIRDDWNASLAYSFQQFSNNVSTLTFDNPFTDTNRDEKIVGAAFRGIGTKTLAQDLAPDSRSHTGTLSGGWDMPFLNARLTGTVSAGGTWQDDPFLPFSTNSAVVTTVPGGTNAADPALLPRQNLDGYVLNVTQNYLITMRPADPLNLTARYRSYYYDNKTPRIELPGYAELIEERWNSDPIHGPAVASYLRQNGDVEADYEVSDNVSARADYGWERWRRWERNVDHTDEHKVGGGFTVKPLAWMKVMADYHYSNRDGDGYNATTTGVSLEAQGARMFDQSDRSRHAVEARFTVSPTDSLDLSAEGSYMHDNYNTDKLGLDRAYTWEAGADVTYSPTDFLTFMANYSHEDSRFRTFGGSKTGAVAGVTTDGANYTDNNLFYSNLIDTVDNFGVGVNGTAIPDKLDFGTYYNYSRGTGKINTFNPGPRTTLVSINSSQALPFEDTETTAQEVRAELTYRFLKRFALNFKYTFESFRVSDFAWNGMANQIPQVVQDGIIVNDTQRVLLMDAQYSDYDAHVGAIMLSYMF
ncbi:MAG: MtrB/PioB family decaheme-associated outer membrane protein, partial [Nitrospirae bacterium]|nr:MtrB/PioB family decaheme-associated outer membrane protein [Nitrospirota bacterium]